MAPLPRLEGRRLPRRPLPRGEEEARPPQGREPRPPDEDVDPGAEVREPLGPQRDGEFPVEGIPAGLQGRGEPGVGRPGVRDDPHPDPPRGIGGDPQQVVEGERVPPAGEPEEPAPSPAASARANSAERSSSRIRPSSPRTRKFGV